MLLKKKAQLIAIKDHNYEAELMKDHNFIDKVQSTINEKFQLEIIKPKTKLGAT